MSRLYRGRRILQRLLRTEAVAVGVVSENEDTGEEHGSDEYSTEILVNSEGRVEKEQGSGKIVDLEKMRRRNSKEREKGCL